MRTSSCLDTRSWLRAQLRDCAYPGYVYGYPHKKAYRPLAEPRALASLWADEPRQNLYCYVHIPFCNQRCSFCNLFTYVPGDPSPARSYLDALSHEMDAYARALGSFRFARLYLGGGTPTYLSSKEIVKLVFRLRETIDVDPARTHGCIEASPETIDEEKLATLRGLGFSRISLGVQTLVAEELQQVNRRFDFALHRSAIEWIGQANFSHFNIDLIYGLPGQTRSSWRYSLEQVIDSPATSLFLYPLYVRPLTGLAIRQPDAPSTPEMAGMYDDALDRLARAGYRQLTMRQFRRDADADADEYCCMHDGMVGLGAGARSYTKGLHYSTPWKMVTRNIRTVVDDYVARMRGNDTCASYGIELDENEQQRRFIILCLLHEGLVPETFTARFGGDPQERFSEIWGALFEEDCVRKDHDRLCLTARGTRHADIVGQMFFSERVRTRMASYEYDS